MVKYWFAEAPANIALIKYMGKSDYELNLPANPSLSYTLSNLKSFVQLTPFSGNYDYWEPLEIPGAKPFVLSTKGQERFINHLNMLKNQFNYSGYFTIRSTNNFPTGSGLASSASSFAALTKCAIDAICQLTNSPAPDIHKQAQLSRLGSGSSCRSFFTPWALWDEDRCQALAMPYTDLIHHVIIISDKEKHISSKEAHIAVQTSTDYQFRPGRARERLKELSNALETKDWHRAYTICWDEFMDMHNLFATANPPFHYINDESKQILAELQNFWLNHGDGPIVTMDAGPNIHLLFRKDQTQMAKHLIQEYVVNQHDYI